MKHSIFKRIGALAMTAVMAFSFAVGASAASEADAIIDTSRKTSLTLFKYDMTSAEEDGAWSTESYVSTGIQDDEVNTALSPYAVQGVEFTYVRLADVSIFKENIGTDHTIMPTYGFREDVNTNSKATVDLHRFLSHIPEWDGSYSDQEFFHFSCSASSQIPISRDNYIIPPLTFQFSMPLKGGDSHHP